MRSRLLAAALLCAATLAAQTPAPPKSPSPAPAKAKPHTAAPAPAKPTGALDKAALEAYARYLLGWPAYITVKVGDPTPAPIAGYKEIKVTGSYQERSGEEIFYVSGDGAKIVRGAVYNASESPFADNLKKIHTNGAPSLGTPGAKVTIVEFTDFQCPFCKEFAKRMRENLLKAYPTEVRLYFKEFPLESIHPWAKGAAVAARCVYRQDPAAFWEYHDFVYDKQADITPETLRAKVLEWAATKSLDTMKLAACIDGNQTEPEVKQSLTDGAALGVNQTPMVFINGRPVAGNLQWEPLKGLIDLELEHAKSAGPSAEECCSIALPVPGKK